MGFSFLNITRTLNASTCVHTDFLNAGDIYRKKHKKLPYKLIIVKLLINIVKF